MPARVVTGYQGGEVNGVDGFWTVRQSDAHAWAEVWQTGQGWVRVDPTSAVAPSRIGTLQRLAAPQGVLAGALGGLSPDLVARLRQGWEALNNGWNQWVLNYTQSRQLDLLKNLGFESPSWEDLSYLLIGIVVFVSLCGAAWTLWEQTQHDPWLRLLARARRKLAAAGLPVPPQAPPRELARLVAQHFEQADRARGQALQDWLLQLEQLRYAPRSPAGPPRTGGSLHCDGNSTNWPGLIDEKVVIFCYFLHSMLCAFPTLGKAENNSKKKPQGLERVSAARKPFKGPAYATREDVMRWADDMAERRDLDREWVRQAIGQSRYLPGVPRLMLPPPSGTAKNWRVYRSRFIDPIRIRAGVAFWQAHRATLERAEKEYGVPAEIIVGIIGVETIYGQQMGSYRVMDALTTLAFDFPAAHPRAAARQEFFRGELEQFLSLTNRTGTDPLTPVGSYAGAMGMPQFMPSSVVKYAVDFDGDGRIDLTGSPADVIGSVASYFKAFNWQSGQPTHFPVRFDDSRLDKDALLAPDILPTFSVASFTAKGAVLEGEALDHTGPLALVELQNGDAPPSYVAGTENFYAITRYNWSSYYAMAVIELGREVAAARATSR